MTENEPPLVRTKKNRKRRISKSTNKKNQKKRIARLACIFAGAEAILEMWLTSRQLPINSKKIKMLL